MSEPVYFRAGGDRTVVMGEKEARGILERFEEELEAAVAADADARHTLDLSCRAWPRCALEILRPIISRIMDRVVVLKIDDIIASLTTEQGLDSLTFFAEVFAGAGNRVEEIDLADNALGIQAIEILRPLLVGPKIRALRLSNCGMALAVGEVLLVTLRPVARQLTELDLSRNRIGTEGARLVGQILADCARLRRLAYGYEVYDYRSNPISGDMAHICQGLAAAGSNLQHLNLTDCWLSNDEAVEDLCRVMQNSAGMETLVLKGCLLSEDGVRAVLTALQNSGCNLRDFNLGGNTIGEDVGAEALVNLLNDLTSRGDDCRMSLLSLEGSSLRDGGTVQVFQALTSGGLSGRLRHLNLAWSGIGLAGCEALATLLKSPHCKLTHINLKFQSNRFDDSCAKIIAKSLKGNRNLRCLYLDGNHITGNGYIAFSKVLCDRSSVDATFLSNHTLHVLGSPFPLSINQRFLSLNRGVDKKQVAVQKILFCHANLDMEPFLEWELKVLPVAVGWFDRARDHVRHDEANICAQNEELNVGAKKLSALYQFVRALPMEFVPSGGRN